MISNKRIIPFALSAMLFGLSVSAEAQQPKKVPRIGYLSKVYMFKLLILALVLTFLSGCATTMTTAYAPKRIPINKPPLNTENVTQLGDVMLVQGEHIEHDAIYLHSKVSVLALLTGKPIYEIQPGFFTKDGENEDSEFYKPSPYDNPGVVVKIVDLPWQLLRVDKGKPTTLCVVTAGPSICADGASLERTVQQGTAATSFQQSLVYSGKVGNRLRIGYREFSKGFARPAFNNDVEYDLSESKIIGYQAARLEVIEATNEYIKYKVLRNFTRVVP